MRLLVFQHIDCEHLGSFRRFLDKKSINWDTVNLHSDETIPKLESYDALWVMGGPMDVWDVEEDTIDNWGAVPAYRDALQTSLGSNGFVAMKTDADKNLARFLASAERVFNSFVALVDKATLAN